MRILQIGPIPPEMGGTTVGGVATHVWELSRHLVDRGHDVAILADNYFSPIKLPVVKESVTIYGMAKSSILKKSLLSYSLNDISTIYKLKNHYGKLIHPIKIVFNYYFYKYVFHHFRPDLLHIHHLELRFPFAYYASENKIPIVTTIHSVTTIKFSSPSQIKNYRKLLSENLKLNQNLIFVSKLIEKEFLQIFGKPECFSRVIPNPIDANKFFPIEKKEAQKKINFIKEIPIVLFVGNLMKRKGVHILLEAVKILEERKVRLQVIMIGSGPEIKNMVSYIKKNKLENTVTILENINHSQLPLFYNASDLFVMPSISESFGLVFLEAMLCGIPVIGTDAITTELIPSEEFGFRIPINNPTALANAIEHALNKKWDTKKIVQHARSFAWEKRIVEFEKLYEAIISNYI